MQAATIKLFLPNGEATGIRTAEISNWTGKAIAKGQGQVWILDIGQKRGSRWIYENGNLKWA